MRAHWLLALCDLQALVLFSKLCRLCIVVAAMPITYATLMHSYDTNMDNNAHSFVRCLPFGQARPLGLTVRRG